MTLRMRDWLGKLVSAPSGARVTELLAIVHPFRPCVPPRTRFICPQCPPEAPTGQPLNWVKVGPMWRQHRSTLRKTVHNGSNHVKIGPHGSPLREKGAGAWRHNIYGLLPSSCVPWGEAPSPNTNKGEVPSPATKY